MSTYPLKSILSTFTNKNGKKLSLYNGAPIGGMSSLVIKAIILAMPFMEFFAIFNDYVYEKVGLVTQIVMFIVFMSIMMMIVFIIIYMNRKSVIKKITPSWKTYFSDVDLNMVLAVGITPYSDFFKHYSEFAGDNLSDEVLQEKLKASFSQMQEENSDLLAAMTKDN
ncbi:hypothetical protein JHD49_03205 [Sulfurimonas sp. SAG-AH-194-C21]|nr:hypothetical protein [Sulfurimonas sp. SAG-AH-194-C21]MDF1882940.1 hypothetical protein [Sulfurimonas sp. SAG-AH-194-C21]